MFGITLGPDQIRRAPREVRRWLRTEMASSLRLESDSAMQDGALHLSARTPEAALEIFRRIQLVLPAVNVVFELGRDGEFVTPEGLVAHKVSDMLQHT